jgi:hypothetical protein
VKKFVPLACDKPPAPQLPLFSGPFRRQFVKQAHGDVHDALPGGGVGQRPGPVDGEVVVKPLQGRHGGVVQSRARISRRRRREGPRGAHAAWKGSEEAVGSSSLGCLASQAARWATDCGTDSEA